jgi:hypothetical protein
MSPSQADSKIADDGRPTLKRELGGGDAMEIGEKRGWFSTLPGILTTMAAVLTAVSGLVAAIPNLLPKPAPPDACVTYAEAAVSDFALATSKPECSSQLKANPLAWHDDYKLHYDWCVTASIGARSSETLKRTQGLHDCRGK